MSNTFADFRVSFHIFNEAPFCDYFNFCQDKNNWCGYNYSFSWWCNWRFLTWYFWPFRVWLKSSTSMRMITKRLVPFQVWMSYVIGQTMFNLLFHYIRQSVILRSLLFYFSWIFIAYLKFSSYMIFPYVSLRLKYSAGILPEISGTVSLVFWLNKHFFLKIFSECPRLTDHPSQ